MITLTLEDRLHPLLGKVRAILPENVPLLPENVRAEFIPSPLGQAIFEHWKAFEQFSPGVTPFYLQLMEEHLHAILSVKHRLIHPLGSAIGGFKTWCNAYYRSMTGSSDARLFSPGFQDTILFHRGQLDRMFNYLADNPRRLAVKRFFPDMFTVIKNIPFRGGSFIGIGNRFLLDRALFYSLQVSRSVSEQDFALKRKELHSAANRGAVVVSPCISVGERMLAREAFEENIPLIVLKNNGFPRLYKPEGKYFDACAAGRLLMLSPGGWGYCPGKKNITREQAFVLNALARRIAAIDDIAIQYHGSAPENLQGLLAEAGFPEFPGTEPEAGR